MFQPQTIDLVPSTKISGNLKLFSYLLTTVVTVIMMLLLIDNYGILWPALLCPILIIAVFPVIITSWVLYLSKLITLNLLRRMIFLALIIITLLSFEEAAVGNISKFKHQNAIFNRLNKITYRYTQDYMF